MRPLFVSFVILLQLAFTCQDQREKKLLRDLLHNYSPQERPVQNYTQPIVVNMSIILQQIIGLDMKNERLSTNVWINLKWRDYKLKWNSVEYNKITDSRLPAGTIWKPDMILFNSAETNFFNVHQSNIILYESGDINWVPPGILKSTCSVDITWFPFDTQKCLLNFGSWTYDLYQMDLMIDSDSSDNAIDTSEYIHNGEWLLVETPARRVVRTDSCCRRTPYVYLEFAIRMRRRTWYYGFNLIIPSTLISLMTVLGFTLPPDACEKITLEITILLTVSYLLSVVTNQTPVTSIAVPLIGTFFNCCLLVVSASVVFTVVVLNFHFRTQSSHQMGSWTRSILLVWLPWMVMMRRPYVKFTTKMLFDKEEREKQLAHTTRADYEVNVAGNAADTSSPIMEASGQSTIEPNLDDSDLQLKIKMCIHMQMQKGEPHNHMGALLVMMNKCCDMIKYITKRFEVDDDDIDVRSDWRCAAMAIDRLCLCIFLLFIVVSTCGIMFSAPQLVT